MQSMADFNKPIPPQNPPQSQNSSGSSCFPIFLLVLLLLIVALGVGVYLGKTYLANVSISVGPTPTTGVAQPTLSSPTMSTTSAAGAVSPTISEPMPTVNPAANWATLTIDGVCEFKYPPAWSWSKTSAPLGASAMVQCGDGTCAAEYNVDLFQVTPLIYKSVDEYIEKNTIKSDATKMELNGVAAVKAAISGGQQAGGSMLEIFFVYKNQGYAANYRFKGLYDKTKLTDFPAANPDILSTLKFL